MTSDTIFALSSGRPPAAIAVIRASGPNALWAGVRLAGRLPEERRAGLRVLRDPDSDDVLDHALVLWFGARASSTGEDVVEFHCHGGRAVADAVVKALGAIGGLRLAEPGEFTRRAFRNGRIDLTQAEGLADLLQAETEQQRRAALSLAGGGLRTRVEQWRDTLVGAAAELNRMIDYVDDETVLATPEAVRACKSLANDIGDWLDRPRVTRLKNGIRVVLAGPPNSGKSSLINALAGWDRAIVSDRPGTTRDSIDVYLEVGGLPFIITDTAGIHDSSHAIEALGIERARALAEGSDILVWLGSESTAPEHRRRIQLVPKCDMPGDPTLPGLRLSSVTGEGLEALLTELVRQAGGLIPLDEEGLNERQAEELGEMLECLKAVENASAIELAAHAVNQALGRLDRVTGRDGFADMEDAIFSRFCHGK